MVLFGSTYVPATPAGDGVAPAGSGTTWPLESIGCTGELVMPCSATWRRMWYSSGVEVIASKTAFGWLTLPSQSVSLTGRRGYATPCPPGQSWCVPFLAPPKLSVLVMVLPF